MKTLKLLLAFLLTVGPLPAVAQTSYTVPVPRGSESVAQVVIEDGDTALIAKYIGTSACASVAVDASTGDLTFTDGPCGAEVATDTFECPVSGALGGVIDVSNAACNLVSETINIVNASSDWRLLPYAALGTDDLNGLSNAGSLVTIAATQATGPNGLALKYDSSVFASSTVVLDPIPVPGQPTGYAVMAPGPTSTSFNANPWANTRALLTAVTARSTYGSETSKLYVYAVVRKFGAVSSETVTTLWGPTIGAATTLEMTYGSCDTTSSGASVDGCNTAWGRGGLLGPPGAQVLVRLTNSAAMSVNTLGVNGLRMNSSGLGIGGVQ